MWLCDTDPWPAAWNRTRGSWDELEKVGRDSRREEGGKGEDAKREERVEKKKNLVSREMREEKSAGRQRQREGERSRAAITLISGSDF